MPRGVARDHDEKRAALRKGAARYFARQGYDRASMTGAARECGVSKALIYHYYDREEALLFDILESHLTELVERILDFHQWERVEGEILSESTHEPSLTESDLLTPIIILAEDTVDVGDA